MLVRKGRVCLSNWKTARTPLFSLVQRTSPLRSTPDFHSALKLAAPPSLFPFRRRAARGLRLSFPATTPTFESVPASSLRGLQRKDKLPSKPRLRRDSWRISGGLREKPQRRLFPRKYAFSRT